MKNDNKYRWSEQFAFGENTPLSTMSGKEIKEIVLIMEENIKNIKKTKYPRHIILETWLILDYSVRIFIVSGLRIDKFSSDDFDLKFELLPQSFKNCLDFLERFIAIQNKLPVDPKKYPKRVRLPTMFEYYMMKYHGDFYDGHFVPILKFYYKKYYPEEVDQAKTIKEQESAIMTKSQFASLNSSSASSLNLHLYLENLSKIPEYRTVSDDWLHIGNNLIKNNFFKTADQFNMARNKASHVFNHEEIYRKFGINGKDQKTKFKKLKEKSISLLNLLDISVAKTKYKKFL